MEIKERLGLTNCTKDNISLKKNIKKVIDEYVLDILNRSTKFIQYANIETFLNKLK